MSDAAIASWNTRADLSQAAVAAALQERWRDPSEYADYVNNNADELVQVLCEVASVDDEGWDHISIGDHAVGDMFVSIGLRLIDERDEWPWDVAGYDMYHDRFTQARGFRVIGWQPLSPVNPPPADAMAALVERERRADHAGFDRCKERVAQLIEAQFKGEGVEKLATQIRAIEGGE